MRRFRLFLCLILAAFARAEDTRAPLCVCLAPSVDAEELTLYKTVILSPSVQIRKIKALCRSQTRVLGRISLAEFPESDAADPRLAQLPQLGKLAARHTRLPDVTHPDWTAWVLDHCAPQIMERGWDGFYLDSLDSARLPDGLSEDNYRRREEALATLILKLKAKYPRAHIVANRGFDTLRLVRHCVDGVLAEGLLTHIDTDGTLQPQSETLINACREELDAFKEAGKAVYALDYATPEDGEAAALYARLADFGYEPFVATPDLLDDSALAPLRRIPDRALVLFGLDRGEPYVDHPADSLTRATLLHPLLRHGYNIEYLNVRERGFPKNLDDYDLVIVEPFEPKHGVDLTPAARTLAARMRSRKKTLFLDSLNAWIGSPECWALLTDAAGWSGSGDFTATTPETGIVIGDRALLHPEANAAPRANESLPDLVAPAHARVLLRQSITDGAHTTLHDASFVAGFGAVLLSPWINERDAIGREKTRVDMFAFADAALGPEAPAFDTTTRDGCRLFFAHVDGDGLHGMSKVELGRLAGEIMRDEIFKKYPMPFTSSVITGEMRGVTYPRATAAECERRRQIARSIFELPNVEVASHSYSHPFAWTQDSVTALTYKTQGLTLLPEFDHKRDYREETLGSIEYINKNLCPPGKQCRLMLWSGNCLPPPEAIRCLDAIGVANMNGLATEATYDAPYLANIRGGNLMRDGTIQVAAPFENDNVYYDLEKDGLEGGFSRVTEAFEITGSPRRLLPVNAYWHFFSADTVERLRALRKVLDWAAARPLHPIHASEYARMQQALPLGSRHEDTRGGHLFRMPEGCLTLRYPGTVYPDMRRSSGILGYRHELGVTYVHTDGSAAVRVMLRADDDHAPRLVYSTRPVEVRRRDHDWVVTFGGFATGKARFEGFTPSGVARGLGGTCRIDATGALEVEARPGEQLTLPTP